MNSLNHRPLSGVAHALLGAVVLAFLMTVFPGSALAQISSSTKFYPPSESAKFFRVSSMTPFNSVDRGMSITEHPDKLSIQAPLIGCRSSVVALNEGVTRNWKIGYVQVLLDSTVHITYEKGLNAWVIPQLPINDSVGTDYPFQWGKKGCAWGYATANVYWEDAFSNNISWGQALPGGKMDPDSRLTGYSRDQSFVDWLIAYDTQNDRVFIIKETRWEWHVKIEVNPDAPLGQRARVSDLRMRAYFPKDIMPTVDTAWFNAPAANFAQKLKTLEYYGSDEI